MIKFKENYEHTKPITSQVVRALWFSISLLLLISQASFAQDTIAEMLNMADIVFAGKIVTVGSTSMAGVPASRNIVEMKVTEVFEKPSIIALAAGDTVTVKVKNPGDFPMSREVTIYAQGWILGNQVAVTEVGHSFRATAVGAGDQGEPVINQSDMLARIRSQQSDEKLGERLEAADHVIEGKVRAIVKAHIVTSRGGPEIISEHNPDWHEAILEVTSTIKGTPTDEILIRFPNSSDVAWVHAPKLSEGQEGVFILTVDQISGGSKAIARGGVDVSAFTALQTTDVLSLKDADRIKQLIKGD